MNEPFYSTDNNELLKQVIMDKMYELRCRKRRRMWLLLNLTGRAFEISGMFCLILFFIFNGIPWYLLACMWFIVLGMAVSLLIRGLFYLVMKIASFC